MANKNNTFPLTVLLIIDAWGIALAGENNAISQANTFFIDSLIENYPATILNSLKDLELSREKIYQILGKNIDLSFNKMGLKQVRIGESENIALLTDFFDCGQLKNNKNYQIKIVSSSIDNKGKSIINKINNEALRVIKQGQVDFMAINLANIDLACRKGAKNGIISEIESVDNFIKYITDNVIRQKGQLVIIGSFGYAERFYDINSGKKISAISNNSVPLIVVAERFLGKNFSWPNPAGADLSTVKPIGSILDFAPSFLSFLKKEQAEFIIKKE